MSGIYERPTGADHHTRAVACHRQRRLAAGDTNLNRYVSNGAVNATDPSGMQEGYPGAGGGDDLPDEAYKDPTDPRNMSATEREQYEFETTGGSTVPPEEVVEGIVALLKSHPKLMREYYRKYGKKGIARLHIAYALNWKVNPHYKEGWIFFSWRALFRESYVDETTRTIQISDDTSWLSTKADELYELLGDDAITSPGTGNRKILHPGDIPTWTGESQHEAYRKAVARARELLEDTAVNIGTEVCTATLGYFAAVGKLDEVAEGASAARKAKSAPRWASNPNLAGKTPLPGTRGTGVKRAAKLEVELVQKTGKGTANWTPDEIAFIKREGRLPPGTVGHHVNDVSSWPDWAGHPRNIKFVRGQEGNLAEHGGAFQNPTTGPLIDRAAMIQQATGVP